METAIGSTPARGASRTWGRGRAIAIDSADYPNVAYRDNYLGYQKFAQLTASGWDFDTAIDLDIAGKYSDIALDSGDNVFIATFDYETIGDDCASLFIKSQGDWDKEQIECGDDDFGQFLGVAVDSDDRAHVTYVGDETLQYAVRTALADYSIETLVDSSQSPKHTAIALDEDDGVHIVYYNAVAKDMKYLYDLLPPTALSIDPDNGPNTGVLAGAAITGEGFTVGSTARLVLGEEEIPGTAVSVSSPTAMTASFDLTGAVATTWDLEVENEAGTDVLEDAFTVTTLAPVVSTVSPDSGTNDEALFSLTVTGQYFTPDMSVTLEKGQYSSTASAVTFVSGEQANAVVNLTALGAQAYDVVVETAYGTDTLENAFEVSCSEPTVDFSGTPLIGSAPLSVQFSDLTAAGVSCSVNSWAWTFGDDATSTDQNPAHEYTEPGAYTVGLTATGPGGTGSVTKQAYITVTESDDDDDDDDDDDLTDPDDRGDDDDDSGCGC